jgi:hypothetical protein
MVEAVGASGDMSSVCVGGSPHLQEPAGNWMYQENTSRSSFVGSKIKLVFGCGVRWMMG